MNSRKSFRVVAATLVVAALGLSGLIPAQAATLPTLTIMQYQPPKTWEPSQTEVGHSIPMFQAVYDNLVIQTPDGKYKPNLATSWVVTPSKATFKLRKGVKFTDGTTFDASVAKANLDALITGTGANANDLQGAKVSAPAADTLVIDFGTFENPEILRFLATADSFMASAKAIGTTGLKLNPVGSGPYIYDAASSVVQSKYVFNINPNYWDKSKQKFSKLIFNTTIDVNARFNALVSGQADAGYMDRSVAALLKEKGFTVGTAGSGGFSGMMLFDRGGTKVPALRDVRVRQAINFALDRVAITKAATYGTGTPTAQIFGSASGVNIPKLDSVYKYDPTKAKALLAAAGYANGFTLTVPMDISPAGPIVKANLAAVGITLNEVVIRGNPKPDMLAGKYAAGGFGIVNGSAYFLAQYMVDRNSAWNPFHTRNSVITNALSNMRHDASPANQIKWGKVINTEIVNEAWFAPYYLAPDVYGSSKKVKVVQQIGNVVPFLYNYTPVK